MKISLKKDRFKPHDSEDRFTMQREVISLWRRIVLSLREDSPRWDFARSKPKNSLENLGLYSEESLGLLRLKWDFTPSSLSVLYYTK